MKDSYHLMSIKDIQKNSAFLQDFANGLTLLDDFDHGTLDTVGITNTAAVKLTENDFLQVIAKMKLQFESKVFGIPKDDSFAGAVANIYQTFDGKDLYPSLEEKAAMLLYSLTKDHCFEDGNKRIAASCFLYFILTLFIAESEADKMEMFRQVIISILNRNL